MSEFHSECGVGFYDLGDVNDVNDVNDNDGFPIVRKLSSTVMWRLLIPQRGQGPLARLGISPWMWNRLNG